MIFKMTVRDYIHTKKKKSNNFVSRPDQKNVSYINCNDSYGKQAIPIGRKVY